MSELPTGWAYVPLTNLAEKLVDGSHNPPSKSEHGLPMLSARNIKDHQIAFDGCRFIEPFAFDMENRRTSITPGDVLLTIVGAIGRTAVVPQGMPKFTLQRSVAVIGPNNAVDANFLSYVFESAKLQAWLNDNAKGTAQRGIYLKNLGAAQIPLPPLPEQRRIVAKIDSLSGKSKRARDHLDHVPLLVRKYKQAILAAGFRGDLTREWRVGKNLGVSIKDLEMRRKASWERERQDGRIKGRYSAADPIDWQPSIQELPAGWVWASVDQITSLIQYGSSAKTSEASQGVAVMRMGNIQDGKLDFSSLKYLPNNHNEFPELLLMKGDVLFNRTNSAELVGKTAVYSGNPIKASFASYLIRLRCCGLQPQLLSGYINSSHGREWVASVVNQQVGQANVNGTKLKQLGIPVMPEAEQSEIVRRIEHAFTWIDRLAADATSARKLVDHLDEAILAKAFGGELVPQDPNDEPASMLLDRIRSERASAAVTKRKHKAKK